MPDEAVTTLETEISKLSPIQTAERIWRSIKFTKRKTQTAREYRETELRKIMDVVSAVYMVGYGNGAKDAKR